MNRNTINYWGLIMTGEHTNILLAEDDDNDVMLLKMAFGKAGLASKLHRVKDGLEAIQYLKGDGSYADRESHPFPSLLMLDLKMPGKNGFEVLEWIRGQPAIKWLIVTVLTASKDHADIWRAYDLGANSYLVKPSTQAALERMSRTINEYWVEMNLAPPCPRN
jgi:CheY-like chemotaxis protein